MPIRTPIAVRAHVGRVTVTILRYAVTGQYVHDFASPTVPNLHATREAAQVEADLAVAAVGHVCDERCAAWRLLD